MKVLKWSTFLLYLAKNAPRSCHGCECFGMCQLRLACVSSVISPYCESSNASANTERFLSDGNAVHYNYSTQTVPRNEVVSAVQAALNGGNNFEVVTNFNSTITFQDLTRNDMELEATAGLDGDFIVSNAFVVDEPDVLYVVTCPASAADCNVSSTFFGTRACLMKEDDISNIPKDCLGQEYDLKFYVVKGPHFMLGASTSIDGCPNIAFSSTEGEKRKIKFETQEIDDLPSYYFGKVALNDILEVEGDVAPTENFNLETENCVHYGQRIWRTLGFTESDELAQFVVKGVLNDPNSEEMAKKHAGGARYLVAKAVGAGTALKELLEGVVYSQFNVN